ncbi:hypothetical protein [Bacillus sp. SD088]|uniref:hypothetical protein n=1 Tax=Bacillus sp. SD088 TaxID=2782012 RepID=UPI001A974CE2|nr:hypothetical protein [Bacillus sp. SD088]MBO0992226.1 hypothetical protein [Bacillus sp. SD088]
MTLQERSRFDVLQSQFKVDDLGIPSKKQESLDRMFHFLYEYSDLLYLSFIREEVLIQYLHYHAKKHFKILPFCEVIKDIKFFTWFLKNRKEINCVVNLDLTLLHVDLWKEL